MPMRKFSLLLVALFSLTLALTASAQQDKSQRPSPPVTASNSFGDTKVVINYGSPAVKGREIWGKLVPYGKVWRTGANEATVFETDQDAAVEGKLLPKGKYGLFTLVNGNEWTIIFNKTWKQWGAYDYKESDDVLRVKVNAGIAEPPAEKMTFNIDDNGKVTLLWGDRKVEFQVK